MDNSVLLVLGILLSSSQGHMGIPNCNLTLCRCQTEKFENEESSLETKDYIIIALFLLVVVLVMVGCYWKRNKDNTKTEENLEKQLQDKNISIKDDGNIQETNNETEETRYVEDPTEPVCQSTKRTESVIYVNADTIVTNRELRPSFGSTPDASETSHIDDGYECSSFTEDHHYANASITKNDPLERHPRVYDSDSGYVYETVEGVYSKIGEIGKQTSTESDSESYKSALENSGSSTMSDAETSETHGEIKASGNNFHINAKNITLNIANQ